MIIVCGTCDVTYNLETPLLVWGEIDGKRTMVEPDPEEKVWTANCRHKNPKVING